MTFPFFDWLMLVFSSHWKKQGRESWCGRQRWHRKKRHIKKEKKKKKRLDSVLLKWLWKCMSWSSGNATRLQRISQYIRMSVCRGRYGQQGISESTVNVTVCRGYHNLRGCQSLQGMSQSAANVSLQGTSQFARNVTLCRWRHNLQVTSQCLENVTSCNERQSVEDVTICKEHQSL